MGAETSTYQDLDVDDELPVTGDYGWTVHDAMSREGGLVTVFLANTSSVNAQLIPNAAKQLKTLRHPSVLKFLALTKSSQGMMLVTEHVTPLELALENLSAAEIASGIHNIIEALVFLHDTVGVAHNNVCMSSIYVSDHGGWKLGGMEHLCSFQEATTTFLSSRKPLRYEAALSPEEKAGKVEPSAEYGHARDAYAFGVVAETLLESLTELGDMTKTFELRIQDELLHIDPKMRPHLHSLTSDRLFKNDFQEIVQFLQHITLKTKEEKKVFFSTLVKRLYDLPSALVATRLVRPLLSRFVLLDATALKDVVPHLLTPCTEKTRGRYKEEGINPLMLQEQFRHYVIPELFKIFHVRDAHIRLVLLSRFSNYVNLFDQQSLKRVILPQILLGLRDSNDELVRESLLAVADLVPILGGDVVIGMNRDKIFAEGLPKFNSNRPDEKALRKKQRNGSNEVPRVQAREMTKNKENEIRTLKELAHENEREKRRDEMKQRNKDRRKKRDERLKNTSRNNSLEKTPSQLETAGTQPVVISDSSWQQPTLVAASTESEDKADWSDWDVKEKSNLSDHDGDDIEDKEEDYNYDQEIEAELESMGSPNSLVFKPIDAGLPVAVNWSEAQGMNIPASDTVPAQKTRGMLKLKTKSKFSPPPKSKSSIEDQQSDWGYQDDGRITPRKASSPKVQSPRSRSSEQHESAEFEGTDEWGNDDWGIANAIDNGCDFDIESSSSQLTNYEHDRESKVNQAKHDRTTKTQAESAQSEKDLGSEFDIKSIEVKVNTPKTDPFDFFSDMEPVIKVKNPLSHMAERMEELRDSTSKGKTSNKMSFAMVETEDDDNPINLSEDSKELPPALPASDGWGNDGWGDDDDGDLLDENLES